MKKNKLSFIKKLENWKFNILQIYNFNLIDKYCHLFCFIKKNHKKIDGDIIEAGVYRGSFLFAVSLFLKKIKSNKKIHGFDSFAGFPKKNLSNQDNVNYFKKLFKKKQITKKHFLQVQDNIFLKKYLNSSTNVMQISSSKDFSDTSLKLIKKKIKLLNLKNIKIIKGNFSQTFVNKNLPKKIFLINLDCDLYQSCKSVLEACWPRVVKGGYIWLDEYYSLKFPGPKIFIDEFIKKHNQKIQTFYDSKNDFYRNYIIKK